MLFFYVELPKRVEVSDYHEFDEIRRNLRLLIPSIKVKEIGFNGNYIGIIYFGSLTDRDNKNLVTKLKKESER